MENRGQGEKRTVGNLRLKSLTPKDHEKNTKDRTNKGRQNKDNQNRFPPKKRADHGGEFHIPAAHTLTFFDPLVSLRHQEQASSSHNHSEERINPTALPSMKTSRDHMNDHADCHERQGDSVRDEQEAKVDDA